MASGDDVTGVGICLPQLGSHVTSGVIRDFAIKAEELGYSGLWVQDHFMYPLSPARGYGGKGVMPPEQYRSVYAPTETLAYVAAVTSRVRLGTSILVAGNHWPVPLAQRLATIDQMSHGRLVAGLGVGWSAEEHAAAGTEVTTRGRRMDDFVPALLACWGDDPVSYDGPIFTIPLSYVDPKPVQRPRPLLLSGMWSADGLARTAKWFDAWNPAGLKPTKVAEMIEYMNGLRDPAQAPLQVFSRSFVQAPLTPRQDDADVLRRLVSDAEAARQNGYVELTLEHNFWEGIESPADWIALLDRFLPVLDAVRG
ncbi:MAG: TIGR03619 family F420-dependent LLM class oxidoreductase [Ilumatobacteraceae bacterium]